MTDPAAHERERATDGVTRVRLANGPLVGPVLCRVVSMVLARADWPVERIDDAMLVCDALCAHAPAYASNDRLTFSVRAGEHEAELRVRDLAAGDAERLVGDAMLPVIGNVLELVAERLSVEPDGHADDSQLVIVLSAGRASQGSRRARPSVEPGSGKSSRLVVNARAQPRKRLADQTRDLHL